jgi:hypothetical protein
MLLFQLDLQLVHENANLPRSVAYIATWAIPNSQNHEQSNITLGEFRQLGNRGESNLSTICSVRQRIIFLAGSWRTLAAGEH